MHEDELRHYGVLGMKWGVRRKRMGIVGRTTVKGVAKIHKGISSVQKRSANVKKKDYESIKSQKDKMLALKDRKGNPLFTEKDVDNMIRGLEKQYKNIESKARSHERFANQLLSEIEQIRIRDLNR